MIDSRERAGHVLFAFAAFALLFSASARAQDDAAPLYEAKCEVCHAADGSGGAPMGKNSGARDFASPEVRKETDQDLIDITANGRNRMPAYAKTLTDSQIKDLVAYIRALADKRK